MRACLVFLCLLLTIEPAAAAPHVLATIKPIHSLVASVMQGVGWPELLVEGAASEHGYALKPSDAHKIAGAEVIFWVGPNLETYLTGPLRALGGHARVVTLENADTVRRLPARNGGLWGYDSDDGPTDPHIWLDAHNGIAMVRVIAAELAHDDPANAKKYYANAADTIGRLVKLDRALSAKLEPVRPLPYIVYHDAYHYFEARYGLASIGAVTVAPDRPIGPRRIAVLRDAVKRGKAICVFREPQFPPDLVTTLTEGTDARVGVLDPLGANLAPGPDLYASLLNNLVASLTHCLAPKSP
jgi:zinc transport system substrate-binding protein